MQGNYRFHAKAQRSLNRDLGDLWDYWDIDILYRIIFPNNIACDEN